MQQQRLKKTFFSYKKVPHLTRLNEENIPDAMILILRPATRDV
jgi:hypothetical protein